MTDPVYIDPDEPGAPQPGDVVVVVRPHTDGLPAGAIGRLRSTDSSGIPWCLDVPALGAELDGLPWWWASIVRRPTEAELVSYHLAHGGTHDPTVYTDPRTPGAPQYGDLVVVARDSWGVPWITPAPLTPDREDLEGVPCMVEGTTDRTRKLFGGLYYVQEAQATPTRPIRAEGWVRAVRRPTEAELATWVLAQPGGAL